ncbi:flavodoxin family protein [Microbacterium sp. RD1]|uniref:flavodoxin family protein n=1 Tax=Microbacterium sp. RD1 TaxID=3457313 RepID=UPI003FA5294B
MVRALALNCTLKPGPAPSSTEKLLREVLSELDGLGVESELVRVVDVDVRPGVEKDMGAGDEWPPIREKVLAADILVLGTPTWMGHPSSVASRVLERLDAELSETDPEGRPILFGKVAVVAVVGNEDGAHKIAADLFQALNDVGYTIPAQGVTYWNGEAMGSVDYQDLPETPGSTAETTATVAANAAHLAALLSGANYPV